MDANPLEIIPPPARRPRADIGGAHDKADAEEAIRAYMLDKTGRKTLTAKQQEIYDDCREAWSYMMNHMSREQTQTLLEKKGMERIVAYRRTQMAMRLWGNLELSDKQARREIVGENAHKLFQLAIKKEDFAAAAKALAVQVKCWGLDRDDPNMPDFAKLDPGTYAILVPAEIQEQLQKAMSIGSFDLDKMPMPAVDVDFEMVEKNTESE